MTVKESDNNLKYTESVPEMKVSSGDAPRVQFVEPSAKTGTGAAGVQPPLERPQVKPEAAAPPKPVQQPVTTVQEAPGKAQKKQDKPQQSGTKRTYFAHKKFIVRYRKKTGYLIGGLVLIAAAALDFLDVLSNIMRNRFFEYSNIGAEVIMLGLGIFLISSYLTNKNKYGKYVKLINVTVGKIPIRNIAELYPTTYEQACKDLQKMIDKKILPGAFIDYRNEMLVLNQNNPNEEMLLDEVRKRQAPKEETKEKKETNKFSKKNWVSLAAAADPIQDQDIKLRVGRIDATLESIRDKAAHDKKLQDNYDLNLFVDFYVPKITSLLGDYHALEQVQDVPRQQEIRKDLIETLDALDAASMNMWNDIVSSDVINISTELDALQKKLVIDGFNDSDFDSKGGNDGRD